MRTPGSREQAGWTKVHARAAALPVVLLILVVTCMLGLSAVHLALLDGAALRNARDRELAFQAAEAGLRDAELDIAGSPDASRSRSALFSRTSAEGFSAGCGVPGSAGLGVCLDVAGGADPAWMQADFLAGGNAARTASAVPTVPYGSFTGRHMQSGTGALPARLPRYLIELLPDSAPGASADLAGLRYIYRITAMGFGARATAQVLLQSFYRKEEPASGNGVNDDAAKTGVSPGAPMADDALGAVAALPEPTLSIPGAEGGAPGQPGPGEAEVGEVGAGEVGAGRAGAAERSDACRPPSLPSAPRVTRVISTMPGQAGRALLLSGLADGAPGLEARDAADPDQVLFRFTIQDDAGIGSISGAPVTALFPLEAGGGPSAYRRFAVVPGAGALFLLALDKDPLAPWQAGGNYFKLELPRGADEPPSLLARPALLPGGDGAIRTAYAGDRQGRLWRFDFSAGWRRGGMTPFLLFEAIGPEGEAQPVSTKPALVFAPRGTLVLFGTGARDAGAPGIQSFYAIRDIAAPDEPVSRRRLAARTLSDAGDGRLRIAGPSFRYGLTEEERQGWHIDFPQPERSVTDPVAVDGKLVFQTWIPGREGCAAGHMRTYVLEALSGLAIADQPTGSLSAAAWPEPLFLVRTALETGSANAFGRRMARSTYAIRPVAGPLGQEGSAAAPMEAFSSETPVGRLAWREVFNRTPLPQDLQP